MCAQRVYEWGMEIDFDMRGPSGPRVIFPAHADEADFEVPDGWTIDFSSQVRLNSGRWSAPLVKENS